MFLSRDAIPITDKEHLVIQKTMLRGKPYVHLNIIADDIVRGHRRTEKGLSFRQEMLPLVINYLQSFLPGPERIGRK